MVCLCGGTQSHSCGGDLLPEKGAGGLLVVIRCPEV